VIGFQRAKTYTLIFMRESAMNICHKNQKEDIQRPEKGKDGVAFHLLRRPLQSVKTADPLLFLILFAVPADTIRASRFFQDNLS
jgi:hypothetical protein